MTVIGVVGDSHIPDRTPVLPEGLTEQLKDVDFILHTGDLSEFSILQELKKIAPVYAVRGNRDWFINYLPLSIQFTIKNKRIVLVHGHGGIKGYIREKILYHTVGFTYENIYDQLIKKYLGFDIIIFGHSHFPVCEKRNGSLLFNPGSLGPIFHPKESGPKIGKLLLSENSIKGEIFELLTGRTIIKYLE